MKLPFRFRGRFLAHVEDKIEAASEPTLVLRGAYQQLLAEQAIIGILQLAGKIELRGEQSPRRRRDLDVKMACPALVSARHDGPETVASLDVGAHMAAQAKNRIVV